MLDREIEIDENTTTDLWDWNRYYGGGFDTVADVVVDFLGPDADAELAKAVTARYREEINNVLNAHQVWLRGDSFYAHPNAVDGSADLITRTMYDVDLGAIADQVENERETTGETE